MSSRPWENMIKWRKRKTFYCSSFFLSFLFAQQFSSSSVFLLLFSIRFYCIFTFMTHLFCYWIALKASRLIRTCSFRIHLRIARIWRERCHECITMGWTEEEEQSGINSAKQVEWWSQTIVKTYFFGGKDFALISFSCFNCTLGGAVRREGKLVWIIQSMHISVSMHATFGWDCVTFCIRILTFLKRDKKCEGE